MLSNPGPSFQKMVPRFFECQYRVTVRKPLTGLDELMESLIGVESMSKTLSSGSRLPKTSLASAKFGRHTLSTVVRSGCHANDGKVSGRIVGARKEGSIIVPEADDFVLTNTLDP
jgi:hypothetical protein